MINPLYRADVVGRLRAFVAESGELSDSEFLEALFNIVLGNEKIKPDADFLNSLADLIERKTTKWVPQDPDEARPTYLCDVCKTPIGHMLWNYCPKCGAEIVR